MNCEVGQSSRSTPKETLGNGQREHGKCQLEVFLLFHFAILEVVSLGKGSASGIAKIKKFIWGAFSICEKDVVDMPFFNVVRWGISEHRSGT